MATINPIKIIKSLLNDYKSFKDDGKPMNDQELELKRCLKVMLDGRSETVQIEYNNIYGRLPVPETHTAVHHQNHQQPVIQTISAHHPAFQQHVHAFNTFQTQPFTNQVNPVYYGTGTAYAAQPNQACARDSLSVAVDELRRPTTAYAYQERQSHSTPTQPIAINEATTATNESEISHWSTEYVATSSAAIEAVSGFPAATSLPKAPKKKKNIALTGDGTLLTDGQEKTKKKTREKTLKCPFDGCDRMFDSRKGLQYHHNVHTGERPFACRFCDQRFVSKHGCERHEMRIHKYPCAWKDRPRGPKPRQKCGPFTCEKCGREFGMGHSAKVRHRVHLKRHGDERPYVCEDCGRSFKCHSDLLNHRRRFHSELGYKCQLCGRITRRRDGLRGHYANMHKDFIGKIDYTQVKVPSAAETEIRYKCEKCGKDFGRKKKIYEQHLLRHTGARSYVCETCGKAYKVRADLANHQARAHANSVYVCQICDKEISFRKDSVRSHMKRIHPDFEGELIYKTREKPIGEGAPKFELKCEHCGKEFRQMSLLRRHIRYHTNDRPFKCDQCDMSFKTDFSLYSHKKQHIEHKFKCDLCGKGFQQKNHLEAHMQLKHSGNDSEQSARKKKNATNNSKSKVQKPQPTKSKPKVEVQEEVEDDEENEIEEEEESDLGSEEIESDYDESVEEDVSLDDDDEDDDFDEEDEDDLDESLDEEEVDPNATPMVSSTKSGRKVTKVRHFRIDENESKRANSAAAGPSSSKKGSNYKSPSEFSSINVTEGGKKADVNSDESASDEEYSSEEDGAGLQEFLSRRRRIQAAISEMGSRGGVNKEGTSNLDSLSSANGTVPISVDESCGQQQESMGSSGLPSMQDVNQPIVAPEIQKSEPIDNSLVVDQEIDVQISSSHLKPDNPELSHHYPHHQSQEKTLHQPIESAPEERLYPQTQEPSIYHQDDQNVDDRALPESVQSPYSSTVEFIRGQGVPSLQDLRSPEPSTPSNLTHPMDTNQ